MTPDELFDARTALGLSRAELGQMLGVSRWAIQRWEKGQAPMKPVYQRAILRRLAEVERRQALERERLRAAGIGSMEDLLNALAANRD